LEGLFAAENKVLFCLENLRQCVYHASKAGLLPPPILGGMINEDLFGIMEAYGECEKVVNQPPPGCIITHLKSTLMVYVCTLPFILVHEVGVLAVVPTTALLSLALFGSEAAAEQIEQPFGNRPYHLPVRGLIINNTRDLGQTSRPVLGFAGYVNSPRDFSQTHGAHATAAQHAEQDPRASAESPYGSSGTSGDLQAPLSATGPLLFGAADAWEKSETDQTPTLASPSGVRPDFETKRDRDAGDDDSEPRRLGARTSGGWAGNDRYGSGAEDAAYYAPLPEKVSLPSRAEDDAGVVEMGTSAQNGGDGWVGDGLAGWVASAKPGLGSAWAAATASAANSARPKKERREGGDGIASPYGSGSGSGSGSGLGSGSGSGFRYPGSSPVSRGPVGSRGEGVSARAFPEWKAQTPIEVFEANDVEFDAASGAERLGNKHRYHVGDSKRRKSIDLAGFRDDTAIPDRSSFLGVGAMFKTERVPSPTAREGSGSPNPKSGFAPAPGSWNGSGTHQTPPPQTTTTTTTTTTTPQTTVPNPSTVHAQRRASLGAPRARVSSIARQSSLPAEAFGGLDPEGDVFHSDRSPRSRNAPSTPRSGRSEGSGVGDGESRDFHGAVTPPRSPTRARDGRGRDHDAFDPVPSRSGSPAPFEENPDATRTWGASDAAKLRNRARHAPSGKPPSRREVSFRNLGWDSTAGASGMRDGVSDAPGLHRSRSMGSFEDDAFAKDGVSAEKDRDAEARKMNGAGSGGAASGDSGTARPDSRPAIWEVFGNDRDHRGGKK
jgi:hypothetical protein